MKYNLLIPMAGKAQRFLDVGYKMPKPLIMAKNKHIIDWAMSSINIKNCNLIFEVRLDHINNFSIDKILKQKFGNNIDIVVVDHDTDGSVCTCLLAQDLINNNNPLIIYTPDVYFQPTFDPESISTDLDGFLLTFKANNPAHSYVELNNDGYVVKTAEKQVLSTNACVGIYYYKSGSLFVEHANIMINSNIRTKNEFYICPMFNTIIKQKGKVGTAQVDKMHVLGTPKELEFFIRNVLWTFGERPIALCCDHSGWDKKEECKEIFQEMNIEYIDFGCYVSKDSDYPDFVLQATNSIKNQICDFGFGFCRTGQGINICANHYGLRSALIFDDYTAEMSIRHNCANFFSIPSKYVPKNNLKTIIEIIKTSSFDGGRHLTRIMETSKE